MAAGERDADGRFPADSVNGRVEARLLAFAHARREFASRPDGPAEGSGDGSRTSLAGP
jgi:hypothetical protein